MNSCRQAILNGIIEVLKTKEKKTKSIFFSIGRSGISNQYISFWEHMPPIAINLPIDGSGNIGSLFIH
jgi:hypothetical protein